MAEWPALLAEAGPWLAGAAVVAGLVAVGAARRAGRAAMDLRATAEALDRGQHRLAGGIAALAEAQVAAQARLADGVERRLGEVGAGVQGQSADTARALGALGARITAIDAAQARIEALSGEMRSLQDILANKQSRGLFGEIQLADILAQSLPAAAYRLQPTLASGRRPDAVVDLPDPPGPIAVDAKFPLEAYRALVDAADAAARRSAARAFRTALEGHVRDIAERYVVPGETAEAAVMFLPSEAVFAELHARFPEVVETALARRVWIVSPTTLMAVLTAMRGLMRDARVEAEAARIRRELAGLAEDAARLAARAAQLETHLGQAAADAAAIRRAAERAGRRAHAIAEAEFPDDEPSPDSLAHASVGT